jgi:L-fuconolactonase
MRSSPTSHVLDTASSEPILEPELPIVDAHHHLWFVAEAVARQLERQQDFTSRAVALIYQRCPRYLFDEFMSDLRSGHNVRATVFNDCVAMYRASGPSALRSVGEVEFVNGVAAMAASGLFGEQRVCAGIVGGGVDLRLGGEAEEVLRAHLQAGGGRYKGVRTATMYDEDRGIVGERVPHRLLDPKFREGFRRLHRLGLSFDALVLEPELPDVVDLARAFPETQIVLNHLGCPIGVGRHAGKREERFPIWRENMRLLAGCDNVAVKVGGLSIFGGFKSYMADPPASSSELADEWRPYVETCIELFGANRCMFESNFPVDSIMATYPVMWNAFKRLAAGASQTEKTALFSGTAIRIYRLDI